MDNIREFYAERLYLSLAALENCDYEKLDIVACELLSAFANYVNCVLKERRTIHENIRLLQRTTDK